MFSLIGVTQNLILKERRFSLMHVLQMINLVILYTLTCLHTTEDYTTTTIDERRDNYSNS